VVKKAASGEEKPVGEEIVPSSSSMKSPAGDEVNERNHQLDLIFGSFWAQPKYQKYKSALILLADRIEQNADVYFIQIVSEFIDIAHEDVNHFEDISLLAERVKAKYPAFNNVPDFLSDYYVFTHTAIGGNEEAINSLRSS